MRPVLAILALSLLLAGHGMSWGLPGGWAQDEIGNTDITGGLARWFVGGWYHRYPPLHFYLLALVHLPLIAADRLDMIDFWSPTGLGQAARMGRALTVAMSVGTAALVYLIGRTTLSIRVAVLASLWWVLVLTVAYYGKVTNLDMPYTFWFAVSLLGYVRALKGNAVSDYVLFAAGAAAAVCTKDQAYGLYLFPIIHLTVAPRPQRRQELRGVAASRAPARSRAAGRCRCRPSWLRGAAGATVQLARRAAAFPVHHRRRQRRLPDDRQRVGERPGLSLPPHIRPSGLVDELAGVADCTRGRCLPVDPPTVTGRTRPAPAGGVVLPDLHRGRRVLLRPFHDAGLPRALGVRRRGGRCRVATRRTAVEDRRRCHRPDLHDAAHLVHQRHDGRRQPILRGGLDSRPCPGGDARRRSRARGRRAKAAGLRT